jgi:hypothetical protein
MARKDRAMIEKSDAEVVFKDNPCSDYAARDFAEEAGIISSFSVATCADSANKSAL